MRRRAGKLPASNRMPAQVLGTRIPMASLIQTLAVAEHLSFHHAAKSLGISQSTVSARIRALEEELGVSLFERNTRGVRLTDAGRYFADLVLMGIDYIDHAVKVAGMTARGECGSLRIAVHALTQGSFLADLVSRYRARYPQVKIVIFEGTAREALTQVRADRLDIAFIVGRPELSDCHSQRVWAEPLMVALPHNHPLARETSIAWADLAGSTFIVRSGGTGPQVYDHILLRLAGRWPAPSIECFDVGRDTLLWMVGEGLGVTLVGATRSRLPISGVKFVSVADEPEPLTFSGIWRPGNQRPPLRKFLALLHEIG